MSSLYQINYSSLFPFGILSCSFVWNIFLCFEIFFVLVSEHYIKQPPLLLLTDLSWVRFEPCQSPLPKLLIVSQTFLIVFDLSIFQYLRVCQEPLVSQKGRSHSEPRYKVNGSQTLRQQQGKYVDWPLPGKKEDRHFCLLPSVLGPGLKLHGGRGAPMPIEHIFVCYSPVRFVSASLIGYLSQVIQKPIFQEAVAKGRAPDMHISSF